MDEVIRGWGVRVVPGEDLSPDPGRTGGLGLPALHYLVRERDSGCLLSPEVTAK